MENTRFDSIMALVDAWASENAARNCRAEAEALVRWCLGIDPDSWVDDPEMTDQQIADLAILDWEDAE